MILIGVVCEWIEPGKRSVRAQQWIGARRRVRRHTNQETRHEKNSSDSNLRIMFSRVYELTARGSSPMAQCCLMTRKEVFVASTGVSSARAKEGRRCGCTRHVASGSNRFQILLNHSKSSSCTSLSESLLWSNPCVVVAPNTRPRAANREHTNLPANPHAKPRWHACVYLENDSDEQVDENECHNDVEKYHINVNG